VYKYVPGTGISVYQGSASETYAWLEQNTAPIQNISGTSTTYSPRAGQRWEWQLQASLSRTYTEDP